MSDSHTWLQFESSWEKLLSAKNKYLKEQRREKISRYHAADCSSCLGEFKGWNKDEQIEFTKDLLKIFKRYWINVISYSMPLGEFVEYFPEGKDDPARSCYGVLLRLVMLEMVAQIENGKKVVGKIKPIRISLFHDRCPYDHVLLKAFNHAIKDDTFEGRGIFSAIAPLSSRECIPLQAADLLAYENFKDSERLLTGRNRRKTLDALLEMDGSFGGRARTFLPGGIRKLREMMDKRLSTVNFSGLTQE